MCGLHKNKKGSGVFNRMRIFAQYLKARRKLIAIYVLSYFVQLIVFFLYSVSVKPVIYSAELIAFFIAIWMCEDFITFYKKHQMLQHCLMEKDTSQCGFLETANVLEQDYQELISKLIQEKYELNEAKIKSMTEMKDYYATWAHQIKTPISAIDILLQAQKETGKLDPKELKNQLFKIDFYVDAVMNYLRLEDLSSDYTFSEYSLEGIVRKAIKKFAPQFIGKKLNIHLENLNVYVKTDEKWLGFILEQLISNAVKYTPEGGDVTIYMETADAKAKKVLIIEDTGIGIAAEDLPRIFDRGYTGYNGRMSKKSSGIGLYLCRKAADRLGISLNITSVPENGTKVYLDLTQKYDCHE